jgi:cytidylate kinase
MRSINRNDMENILKLYFEKKHLDQQSVKSPGPGPIITFSREYGCPSKPIAQLLTDTLNKRNVKTSSPKWKFISKEVVEEAARKLDIKTVEMNYLISSGEKGFVEDLLTSFSPHYVSSRKIKNILNDVIRTISLQGHLVIVGRGSVAILQGHPKVLHVRLQAPLDWRVKEICAARGITETEALRLTNETDKKRNALIELFLGSKFDQNIFDVVFNCKTFSKEEIVQSTLGIMETKKMI